MKQGRPKSKEEPTEQVATRIPASLKGKYKKLAKSESRTLAAMLRVALEHYAATL